MDILPTGNDKSGTTPISPDEEHWLIPSVATRAQLNLIERENILEARRWLFSSRRKFAPIELLDHVLIREAHRRMFRHVWRWAGKQRDNELNLGVAVQEITPRLATLLGDARAWIDYETYSPDEICVRLHHGLVAIHPWRNGNGRHARLIADRMAVALDRPIFTWGGGPELTATGDTRNEYLVALKQADQGDFEKLNRFARG
ncbi:mobile mystery protein B [Opitutaceae bacterium]|nr:mobile mystery protein B [Opitutaceae bacterium]